MKRLITYPVALFLSLVLSCAQFFLTGIYGKIVFIPIFVVALTFYETKQYYSREVVK